MKEIEYVVCPLCGMNHVLYSPKRAAKHPGELEYRWADFNPRVASFIQIREGGGRGSGFRKVVEFTIEQTLGQFPAYRTQLMGMKAQLIKVVKEALRLGIIALGDL